ncbi:hypothetical protein WT56_29695 [Burkholderia pseudomultivorans]|uniref:Uncharacterized protein n=1 Tax=Burkholderia pseudomultivorans TaxID=1207504 RepID=A0A132E981_9BURK|nr:hypothetical protein WT56_29695 [Burkholderia pseudomultivorans]
MHSNRAAALLDLQTKIELEQSWRKLAVGQVQVAALLAEPYVDHALRSCVDGADAQGSRLDHALNQALRERHATTNPGDIMFQKWVACRVCLMGVHRWVWYTRYHYSLNDSG